jgi:hypothetical protein
MDQLTQSQVSAAIAQPKLTVSIIHCDELAGLIMRRAIDIKGRGDVMVADYVTDMLKKGKLRASAKAAFPDGLRHNVTVTCQVNYDYDKKLQNRTDGEEHAKGGSTWQQAVLLAGHLTPLTTHKDDVIRQTEDDTICQPSARFYLRYEPITEAQKAAGFGKNDRSVYTDGHGTVLPYDMVKPFFFERKATPVNHRTLTLNNLTSLKMGGIIYQLRQD